MTNKLEIQDSIRVGKETEFQNSCGEHISEQYSYLLISIWTPFLVTNQHVSNYSSVGIRNISQILTEELNPLGMDKLKILYKRKGI